jgi:glutathione S-transferase
MKLYLSPGACSLSCHIAFEEAKLPYEPVLAKGDQEVAVWSEIGKLNPQKAVPILKFEDGTVLTQNIGILNYVAEKAPASGLLPVAGSIERAQVFRWLSWVGADLHKTIGGLFDPSITPAEREQVIGATDKLLTEADAYLEGKTFLVGEKFTVADCYLFTVYGWTKFLKVPNQKYSNLNAYSARVFERPAVQAAMLSEGLIGGHHDSKQ